MTVGAVTPDYLTFWGKARPGEGPGPAWHPVAYHLLDVAACAEAILRARPLARSRAAELLALDPVDAERLLVTLVGLHDIGKFAPGFQAKAPTLWPAALGRLQARAGARHTDDGYVLWRDTLLPMLGERIWRGGQDALQALALPVFGHHGRPLAAQHVADRSSESAFGRVGRQQAIECADAIVALLHPKPIAVAVPPTRTIDVAAWWIAGLVTVADWLGSNQRWFGYVDPAEEMERYWVRTREQARAAVREAGLVAPRSAALRSFRELTRIEAPPTPAQDWASSVVLPPGPVLVILEDVTGSGKTEAAQMLVHRLMVNGRAAGAYWGMPTQATANAMYERQARALDGLFGDESTRPSLVLAHGQAHLHERFRASVLGGNDAWDNQDDGPSDEVAYSSSAACAAFLADDRRASMLADVGAGTVDQAFLSVLPSRFNTVRLFGIADKVLVLDEVHSYDAYMDVEVQDLLRFQAALGGCAIVLTATLARRQRQALVSAWADGLDQGRRRLRVSASGTAYPLASIVAGTAAQLTETPLGVVEALVRRIGIRFVSDEAAALECVIELYTAGASVAWIRNTVDDCLAAAAALRSRGILPTVFHARFAQHDRQRREREVVDAFRSEDIVRDRSKRVVVATQVIEQSLDIDFDAMVSDLAPIDLLIQRAGRLWRNPRRVRPVRLPCELVVLTATAEHESAEAWLRALPRGTIAVYANVGVLWRTADVLGAAGAIESPVGLRQLVESVYDGDQDDLPEPLVRRTMAAEGKEKGEAATANYTTLKVGGGYRGDAQPWVDDLRVLTRSGEPQIIVRLARVHADGSLAPWAPGGGPPWKRWALSEVRVSMYRVPFDSWPEPAFEAAVAAIREEWGRFEQGIPVLPLQKERDGDWTGKLLDTKRNRVINCSYSEADGLAFL